ncbi:hypothetical protein BDZ45DRAFT_805081 [Acephala macrosclerotiorum]|nr:hypothetical protein BDZ45DRAFT_805081 [Acephala macrosclerotiorum]
MSMLEQAALGGRDIPPPGAKIGPSSETWDRHRVTITNLWSNMSLQKVRERMEVEHGFIASNRMYGTRFKEWGLRKNLKSDEKTQLLSDDASSDPPSLGQYIGGELAYKLQRHSRSMSNEEGNSDTRRGHLPPADLDTASSADATRISTPSSWVLSNPTRANSELLSPSIDVAIGLRTLCESSQGCDERPPPTPIISPEMLFAIEIDFTLMHLETVLRSIDIYCSHAIVVDFNEDGTPTSSSQPSASVASFWKDIQYGIYLLKVSSGRAWSVIKEACAQATRILPLTSTTTILQLLTTLSPVNTGLCIELQIRLLKYFGDVINHELGESYPLAIILRGLQHEKSGREGTERALKYIWTMYASRFGPFHSLTLKAKAALVRLLRRDHATHAALHMGRQLLNETTKICGTGSLEARGAAREVEHVLVDTGDYLQALKLCFTIVGTCEPVKHLAYYDNCTVHTMEDIAKIYDRLGNIDLSTKWLELAAYVGRDLWGPWVGTMHIVDKLVLMLLRAGRQAEATAWRESVVHE